jgi:hypothetical protein
VTGNDKRILVIGYAQSVSSFPLEMTSTIGKKIALLFTLRESPKEKFSN